MAAHWALPQTGDRASVVKRELRKSLRERLTTIPEDQLAARSLKACHLLFQQREFARAKVLTVFLSRSGEIDTAPLVLRGWQEGKKVLAPKISWEQRRLMPVEIRSLSDDLRITAMGVREPAAGIPIPISMIDLVIVPGLGFDNSGNRLGRGQGFYDRFLAHPEFHGVACALAFEDQIIESIPVGPLDRHVDMLVTNDRVRRFKHQRSANR